MGTSKVYGSPKWPGVNHSVGDAVTSGDLSDQVMSAPIGAFASAYKNYLASGTSTPGAGGTTSSGRGVSGGGSRGGGSGGAARMRSASSGARLAQFISTAIHSGLDAALREYNLAEFRNKPLDEFLELVTESLSSDGGLLDDNALNLAMAETINELAEAVSSVEELDILLTSGNVNVEEILQIYFANILAANFEQKEYSFVREKVSRENTKEFFVRAREVIRAIVRDELSAERDLATINWNSADGQLIADAINRDVLEILIA